jgi:hypothetical protein
MLHAKKGNRQIKITKNVQEDYQKQGYEIFELTGKGKDLKKKVLFKPDNIKDLKAENIKLKAEIVKLEAKIKSA